MTARTFAPIPRQESEDVRAWVPPHTRDALPSAVNHDASFHAFDQGNHGGACTANAFAALAMYTRSLLKLPDMGILSRLFSYYNGLALQAHQLKPVRWGGDGCGVESIMRMAATHGVVPETFWPYRLGDYHKLPAPGVYAEGEKHVVGGYASLTHDQDVWGNYLLGPMKACVAAGNCFMAAFVIADSIGFKVNALTYVVPKLPIDVRAVKSHAVVFAGFDDTHVNPPGEDGRPQAPGAFLCHNSWPELPRFWYPYGGVVPQLFFDAYTISGFAESA